MKVKFFCQLSLYLRRVNFTTPLGEQLYFDENGDPPASFDILNWHVTPQGKVEFVNIGYFVSSEGSGGRFHIDMDRVIWGGGQGDKVCQGELQWKMDLGYV